MVGRHLSCCRPALLVGPRRCPQALDLQVFRVARGSLRTGAGPQPVDKRGPPAWHGSSLRPSPRRRACPVRDDRRPATAPCYRPAPCAIANGQLLFSATDLSRHLACNHLTSLRRSRRIRGARAAAAVRRPTRRGPEAARPRARAAPPGSVGDRRADRRDNHPARHAVLAPGPRGGRRPSTRDAMRRRTDVIYQGRLEDEGGRWSGYPDFLLRVDRPSACWAGGPTKFSTRSWRDARRARRCCSFSCTRTC